MSSKKKEVQPRVIWSYQETEDLIEIMQSKFINKIVLNKNCRKWPIFEEIKKEMDRYGHDKSTQQIIFKYKNLCAMYRAARQSGKKPPAKDKRFEFYDKMHELFQEVDHTNSTDLDDDHDNMARTDMIEDEEDDASGNESQGGSSKNNITENSNKRYLKRELSMNEDEDPLRDEWNQILLSPSAKRRRTQKNELSDNNEIDIELEYQPDETVIDRDRKDSKAASYIKCVNYLVRSFKNAQDDLQNKFFQHQLRLQQQQQEWEERMLDEEREFFSKVFKNHIRTKDEYSY